MNATTLLANTAPEDQVISIVTISYSNIRNLVQTIESVSSQVISKETPRNLVYEHIIVASGMSDGEIKFLQKRYLKPEMTCIFNQDDSLYEAMNIGLGCSRGTHVLFLNSGDLLFSDYVLCAISHRLRENAISLFRVVYTFGERAYIRPGPEDVRNFKKYGHQGFLVPLTKFTPRYNEELIINSDSEWKSKCLDLFDAEIFSDPIVIFSLGGVSNCPTAKTIMGRFATNGYARGMVEVGKFFIYRLIGPEAYYHVLARRQGYEVIDL